VKVFDSPHAFVGLHARSVILISQPALRFLTPEELQAAVAHETGHEYVWIEFEKARARQDFARLQELELFCDAVAIVTLRRAGLNPSSLVSGLEELLRYENERFEPGKNEARYVSQDERKKFAGKVMKWARVTTPAAR
jgi:hypothetical protein